MAESDLLGISYNRTQISDYWTNPFLIQTLHQSENSSIEKTNYSGNLAEKSLILLSSNCLDCNYKTKRQRQVETKIKEKFNTQNVMLAPRVLPILGNLELLSSILTLSDFNLTAQLGKGSFGTVFMAEFIEEKRQVPLKVALKVIQTVTNKKHSDQLFKSFASELNVIGLKHPNIVMQLGHNDCDLLTKNAFIIYELCGTLNLKQFLLDHERVLSISKRKSMSLDLVKALEFIHSNNIVHMDIKPANIIVTNNQICKLTDFGCSIKLNKPNIFLGKNELDHNKIINSNQYEDNRWTAGTWFYTAPELFRGNKARNIKVVSSKCDIYSLGIVMWQLLTRESPYNEYYENPQVVIYQIISKKLRPRFPLRNGDFKLSPLVTSRSTDKLSAMTFNKSCETQDSHLNTNVLENSRSVFNSSDMLSKSTLDNSEFENVYRNLIELSWSDDPDRRNDAKTLKEVLINTKIAY